VRRLFFMPICAKEERRGPPSVDKEFLKLNPDKAMLFAPFGCPHPPPPSAHTEPSPKDIAESDITLITK